MPELKTNVLYYGDNLEPIRQPKQPAPSRSWTTTRKRVLQRDGFQCQICGDAEPLPFDGALFVHHIILRSRGGTDDLENLITLCDLCHQGVLHGWGKWLGVLTMADAEKQRARLDLFWIQKNYEWFLHLHLKDQEEFLRVQNDIWSEWGVAKRK